MLNREDAARMLDYTVTAGLDASVLTLGRGDTFCVRITAPTQWHLWDWEDWVVYYSDLKKQRKQQRKQEEVPA